MNDRPSKRFQITLNVDAEINVLRPRSRETRRATLIKIDLELNSLGNPTTDFRLVERSEWGVVEGDNGPDQVINLKELPDNKDGVKIIFTLVPVRGLPTDLQFSADARKSFGIQSEEHGCPIKEGNPFTDQFSRRGIIGTNKKVALRDKNKGGGRYRFALLVYRGADLHPVARCDPRIINK